MSKVITKKVYSRYFDKILSGEKTYEVRLADWKCEPGDTLELIDIDDEAREPTGRVIRKKVGEVIRTKEIEDLHWWSDEDVKKHGFQVISLLPEEGSESKRLSELATLATEVRDHYAELQIADGHKAWGVAERMAGFVGDVGDLSKLIMAKQGLRRGPENIDEALAHELSDTLWCVLVIADELGIDIEAAFVHAMEELHERIETEKADATRWKRVAKTKIPRGK